MLIFIVSLVSSHSSVSLFFQQLSLLEMNQIAAVSLAGVFFPMERLEPVALWQPPRSAFDFLEELNEFSSYSRRVQQKSLPFTLESSGPFDNHQSSIDFSMDSSASASLSYDSASTRVGLSRNPRKVLVSEWFFPYFP